MIGQWYIKTTMRDGRILGSPLRDIARKLDDGGTLERLCRPGGPETWAVQAFLDAIASRPDVVRTVACYDGNVLLAAGEADESGKGEAWV